MKMKDAEGRRGCGEERKGKSKERRRIL